MDSCSYHEHETEVEKLRCEYEKLACTPYDEASFRGEWYLKQYPCTERMVKRYRLQSVVTQNYM